MSKIWTCKIGYAESLSGGADRPMARAVEAEFHNLTGKTSDFCFSGWGGKLTPSELAVIEDRMPRAYEDLTHIIELLTNVSWNISEDQKEKYYKALGMLIEINFIEKLKHHE